MLFKCENPTVVAKRAFWLAWQACGNPFNMGWLNDNPEASEDEIWEQVTGVKCADYAFSRAKPNKPYGDYVFGRMMKLGAEIVPDGLKIRSDMPRLDYQAWCGLYPTYEELFNAAVESLNASNN